MKYDKRMNRLVVLLARGYVGFTVAIVLITAFSLWIGDLYFERLSRLPDIDGLISDRDLAAGRYEAVAQNQYLDKESGFAVTDEKGNFIYLSSEVVSDQLGEGLTRGELDCIQPYEEDSYVESVPFHNDQGDREYMLVRHYYGVDAEGEKVEDKVVILDDRYQVRSGSLGDGRKAYTEREVAILSGEWPAGYDLMKYSLNPVLENGTGEENLVILAKSMTLGNYEDLSKKARRMYLFAIPLYLLAVTAFVFWLNRKIKRPLVRLDEAIDSLSSGGNVRTGELNGPWEIQKIGNNFDRMADMLSESERQRRKMDDERNRLLADISHDLKTPITVIAGYTRALRDGKIPPEKAGTYLELIDSKVVELTGMIESFHEFSKVEHPGFALQTVPMDICEFMRGYLAERYDEIELAGFSLKVMIPEQEVWHCRLDAYQFRRALDNLLYNTLKYNTLGTKLAVGVTVVSRGAWDKKSVRIIMADNGIGIPASKRDTIFEPFVQGDESRGSGGSGLGLAITRRIIQAHNGRVALSQVALEGFTTEFEILLPLAEDEDTVSIS